MDFQAVARPPPPCFGTHWMKHTNIATYDRNPGLHSGCVPAGSYCFPGRPRLIGSLLRRKCDGTDKRMVVGLPFSVNVRAFPKGTQSGQIAIEKWPSSKCFQGVCGCQHTKCWESCATSRRKRHQQRVFSGLYLAGTVLLWRCESCSFTQRT